MCPEGTAFPREEDVTRRRSGNRFGTRGSRMAVLVLLVLALTAGIALSTEGESYPRCRTDDTSLNESRDQWESGLRTTDYLGPACTGAVEIGGGEYSLPTGPNATPDSAPRALSQFTEDDGALYYDPPGVEIENAPRLLFYEPWDDIVDPMSTGVFVFLDFTAFRANFFFKIIAEVKNGKKWGWDFTYVGDEFVTYTNGSDELGMLLSLESPASISWARKIVDYDMRDGQGQQEKVKPKRIVQNWAVVCYMVDGQVLSCGREFTRHVPDQLVIGTSSGLDKTAGGEVGWEDWAPVIKGVGGLTWVNRTDQSSSSQSWVELTTDKTGIETRTAPVAGSAYCPCEHRWFLKTFFSCGLDMVDESSGNRGSRQELLVRVRHEVSSFLVDDCWPCPYLREPEDPVPDPPPSVTPTDTPYGPAVTPTFTPPPVTTPSDEVVSTGQRSGPSGRDVDGDGDREGLFMGPLGSPSGWAGPPYWLGLARLEEDPGVFTSIERWSIGQSGDMVISALVDPWNEAEPRRAIAVVKDSLGTCTLVEVVRAQTGTQTWEEWYDREDAVPATLYATTVPSSTSLSSLLSPAIVAGAELRETEVANERILLVRPILVRRCEECSPEPEDSYRHLVGSPEYEVTRDTEGHLVLTLYDW